MAILTTIAGICVFGGVLGATVCGGAAFIGLVIAAFVFMSS